MRVIECYQLALECVLSKLNISPLSVWRPNYRISEQATLKGAVRYTYWYSHRGDTEPNYRFRRYVDALCKLGCENNYLSHIDIGCGAGPFSWAFLDWAAAKGIERRQVKLFGLDRCPAMIQAANLVRDEIAGSIPDYPSLHYYHDTKSFQSAIRIDHRPDADSIITLGHVLVQSKSPADIQNFTQIISVVRKTTHPARRCYLVAVDALKQSNDLQLGWNLLLKSLEDSNITCTQVMTHQHIKIATLAAGV